MKTTPFTDVHIALGAKMHEFAGFNMPIEYTGIIDEHMTVVNGVGVFDVSHMGEFWVKGPNALAFIQGITSNDASVLPIGKAQYTCFPNDKGGIVDDLLVYHYEPEKYHLPFDVMLPLIDETARKVHELAPRDAQTGPAVRYDENVMNKHLSMLADSQALQEIYKLMSKSIHEHHQL